MTKFDGSDYENWKPLRISLRVLFVQKGALQSIATPVVGAPCVLFGIARNAPTACFAGLTALILPSRLKMVK